MHKIIKTVSRDNSREVGDDYSESSSIDNTERNTKGPPPLSVDEMNGAGHLPVRQQPRQPSRHSQPAYCRQLTVSGIKIPKVLSFYKRGARESWAGGNRSLHGGQGKMATKMLTCDELSDLFRRLDRNGNGTLEKFEFMDIVKKLRLDVSEQFLLGVFQEVDAKTKAKGTLTLRNFVQCYQILYYEACTSSDANGSATNRSSKSNRSKRKNTSFRRQPAGLPPSSPESTLHLAESLQAVRYGHDAATDQYVYEVYSGHCVNGSMVISEKKTFTGERMGHYEVEAIDVDLGHLNQLMAQDSVHNSNSNKGKDGSGSGSQLFWWLDVAMEEVQASRVEKYIIHFGLPNDSRFRSRFSQFGDPLPREANGNFHAGNGDTNLGSNSTLSLFTQAIWMSAVPLVYNTAPRSIFSEKWAEWVDEGLRDWVEHYYHTRFAFMLAAFVSAPPSQREQAYDSARSLSRRFHEASDLEVEYCDNEDDDQEMEGVMSSKERREKESARETGAPPASSSASSSSSSLDRGKSYDSSKPAPPPPRDPDDVFADPPLFVPPNRRTDEPTWLQETHALRKVTSRLEYETMGIHMIDLGSGPIATLTIRRLDDEGEAERAAEAEARRLKQSKRSRPLETSSARARLMFTGLSEGGMRGGQVAATDPFEDEEESERQREREAEEERARVMTAACRGCLGRLLVGIRRKLLENFYCKGVTAFAADIADGPFALTVHLASLVNNFSMNTLGHLENWKVRLESEVNDLAVSKHIAHANELKETVNHIKDYVDNFYRKIESFSIEAANEQASQCLVDEVNHDSLGASLGAEKSSEIKRKLTMRGMWGLLRTVRKVVDTKVHTHSVFPKGVEGTDLTYDMLKPFFGKDPLGDLNSLIFGNEILELTGLEYWHHRMTRLHEHSSIISQDIRESLDEKRNFYNYLLAVVTVFLGPMTILTGYWGMNFENMPELSSDFYSWFPGVKLLWAAGGLLYGMFFLLAIHYRIIYSAT